MTDTSEEDQTKVEVTAINEFFGSFVGKTCEVECEELAKDNVLRTTKDGSRCTALLKPLFSTSHACNILVTPLGTIHLVWFSGMEEGGADNGILHSVLSSGASAWSTPKVISVQADRSAQNPVIFYDTACNRLTLLHTSQAAYKGQSTSEVRIVHSQDDGETWSTPEALFNEPGAFTKNNLLKSADGCEWLLPMYYTPDGFFVHHSQYSTVRRSKDGGLSWYLEANMPGTLGKLVQPTVVRTAADPARLLSFFRSRAADYIYKSESLDDGRTWSPASPTPLPNNNSGIQAAVLANGHLVMVFNNVQGKQARCPLSIGISEDDGVSWPYVRDLEPYSEERRVHKLEESMRTKHPLKGEYSYPSIVQTADGYIHIAYTFRRETVRYVRVSEDWVRSGGTVGFYVPL
mmetsp:Transcript_916/g.1879  ORF Transcript_916/g.1879 Transcript_916/m.1879 type:complete len:404 (-) Transcript_916:302-1513(-)